MVHLSVVMAATDFSPSSRNALRLAARLASTHHARLYVFHAHSALVPRSPNSELPALEDLRGSAQTALDQCVEELAALAPDVRGFLGRGDPRVEIPQAATEIGADVIVIGTHGHTGLTRLLLGSVAERVVRVSTVPVMTVRGDAAERVAVESEPAEGWGPGTAWVMD